jgi:serine/threonine-protein kinase HipA
VTRFKDEIAIVIERYDRQRRGNDVVRIHQEDICQALGIMPTQKYQNEGGPSAFNIVELLPRARVGKRDLTIPSLSDWPSS